ncbi:hypothetical protein AGMMS49959_15340 [Planctomycetales bacterium]|nr:hypothetical protein AGMMS49959_15340 [Planctomycetales bacterium]
MNLSDVCSVIIAPARTGKTYYATDWIVSKLLPETKKILYTNLPLRLEAIIDYCRDKYSMDAESVKARVHLIPREVEIEWKNDGKVYWDELTPDQQSTFKKDGTSKDRGDFVFAGPWLYFYNIDVDGSLIFLDEIHNFCGTRQSKGLQDRWFKFIAELGHRKSMIRGISQNYANLGDGIKRHVQTTYRLENTSQRKIPLLGSTIYEIQMLAKAFFCLPYAQPIVLVEDRADPLNPRKTERVESYRSVMTQKIFNLYDSFNKPIEGSQEEDTAKKPFKDDCDEALEKYGKFKGRIFLLVKFLAGHQFRLLFVVGVVLLVFHGPDLFVDVIKNMNYVGKVNAKMKTEVTSSPPLSLSPPLSPASRFSELDLPPLPDAPRDAAPETKKRVIYEARICAMSPEFIAYDDGLVVGVGDEFRGDTIAKIDYKTRKVHLTNGKIISVTFGNYAVDVTSSGMPTSNSAARPVQPRARN